MSCPRCELKDFGREKRPDGIRHKAVGPAPSIEELQEWMSDSGCESTCADHCWVEPDGHCPHGHSSWLLVKGLI